MGLKKRISSLFKSKQNEENLSSEEKNLFVHHESRLLEELIAVTNGRYDVPIRTFTAKQINKITNNFAHHSVLSWERDIFISHMERRQVLVTRGHKNFGYPPGQAINDIVFGSQMSHLKNVLKLIRCCLEFEIPVSVYEFVEGFLLSNMLSNRDNNRILSWRKRIKIASDVAHTISYLHTSFEAPVIYRDLSPCKVIVDQHGVAKLFNFSLCISIPLGELGVETPVAGTYGHANPTYVSTGYVTQKADVFGLGMFCLSLLTGKKAISPVQGFLLDDVKCCADNHQYDKIIDPRILEEVEAGSENLLQSFLDLALMCTQDNGEDRPDMIDVAKQIRLLEKSFPNCLPTINS